MSKPEQDNVFQIDEGFGGQRISVYAYPCEGSGGGGRVQIIETDRDASICIDFDVWDRIVKAVARAREE